MRVKRELCGNVSVVVLRRMLLYAGGSSINALPASAHATFSRPSGKLSGCSRPVPCSTSSGRHLRRLEQVAIINKHIHICFITYRPRLHTTSTVPSLYQPDTAASCIQQLVPDLPGCVTASTTQRAAMPSATGQNWEKYQKKFADDEQEEKKIAPLTDEYVHALMALLHGADPWRPETSKSSRHTTPLRMPLH